ncbi:MAG: glycosyltransferase family 39 protein [Candidatus Daviesbacteria bacterium]|nr:glycosyltransferase family 39 protein [Candidatus Daviesbacteria bacterium]
MNKIKYLLLILISVTALSFRFYINYFIPVNQQINLLFILLGLFNLILLFCIIQRLANYKIGLLAALLYAISPWTAYLELVSSPYIFLLSSILFLYLGIQIFNVSKGIFLLLIIAIGGFFLYRYNQITVFSNIGLINDVNSFRGETNQTFLSPLGKIIENRYIYLSEHLTSNILKQFTPATYFTNQVRLLGFSNSSPIYLGFITPFLFGVLISVRLIPRKRISEIIAGALFILPSILSKDSPDLSRLILISPIIFFVISIGLYEFILNYRKKVFLFLLFLTVFMVVLQFLITISDIAVREPVRLQMFLDQK